MATETQSNEKEVLERVKCKSNFLHFLRYVYILEPPPGKAIIHFELWPHLLELIRLFFSERLILVLKARQIGISWLLAIYALWRVMFHRASVVLMLSKGQDEATDLLGKAAFVYSQLPDFLKLTVDPDQTQEMGFPVMYSKVKALPATKTAGRSEAASLVIADEHDFHPYARDNYGALKPTIDAGGQFIGVSTVDKTNRSTMFKELYRQAKVGANNFTAIFLGWRCRPGRNDAWYEAQKLEYSATPELLEQEYPSTEEEALAPSRVLAAFNIDALTLMQADCREPVERVGLINVYRKHVVAGRYVGGTDTSHGVGRDDAVSVVLDAQTGAVVADIHSNLLSPEALAESSVKMLGMYGNPLWGIEDNDWGILVIRKAQELGYKNLFCRDWLKDRTKSDNPGWHTDEKTRYFLWGELIEAIQSRLIIILSKDGLAQFFTVIRNPDKQGRIEGMEGTHDDYPLAVGIAWQMRKYVSTGVASWAKVMKSRGAC